MSKWDKFREISDSHFSNIKCICSTLEVLKLDISIEVSDFALQSINDIFSTDSVEKFDKSKDFNEVQPKNIPFMNITEDV